MVSFSQVQERKAEILRIAAAYGAENVRVFGSVVRGQSTPSSDLDLLVRMSPGKSLLDHIALKQDLEDLLDVKVDVVNEDALHPAIRQSVLEEGVPL